MIRIAVRTVRGHRSHIDMTTGVAWVDLHVEIVGKAERIGGTLTIELPETTVSAWVEEAGAKPGEFWAIGPQIAEWLGIGYTR